MHVGAVVGDGRALARRPNLPALYLAGVAIVAILLAYEQSLVSDDDLSQVKRAFDLNGYVGHRVLRRDGAGSLSRMASRIECDAAPDKAPDRIAGMFDAIAPRYDLLNHVLSAGIDRRWRARAIRSLQLTGRETLLDVCTGTADVALEARRGGPARRTSAVDATAPPASSVWTSPARCWRWACRRSARRVRRARIVLVRGDAMRLPVPDGSADAVTVAFGIRNVQRPDVACAEMARVLRRGGRLAILEFGVPRVPGRQHALSVVFQAPAAAGRPDGVGPRRGVFVSSGVGWHVSAAAGVHENPAAGRFRRG